VDLAKTGGEALEMIARIPYDVAIFDIHLPDADGVEVMQRAAKVRPAMAAILLTGFPSLGTAIAAVRAQAADYLRKPATVRDITRAIAAALDRRAQRAGAGGSTPDRFVQAGPLALDREQRLVTIGTGASYDCRAASLTRSEATILSHLMAHPGVVVSSHELAGALGYTDREEEAHAIVRPHISRLRRKIEPDPASPSLVLTVPRQGYVLKV